MSEKPLPTTLVEAIRYFDDPQTCIDFVAKLRWPNGPVCPSCGGTEHSYLTTRRVWKCRAKDCHRQFSVKVGTIFEDSPIKLKNWLAAIWLIANSKNGISSHELGRAVGLTQKSAWFVLHRIRLAMQTGTFQKLDGEVEVDETFIGGRQINKHQHKRLGGGKARGNSDKAIVVGALERGGHVRAKVVSDRSALTLIPFVQSNIQEGATIYTDEHYPYGGLRSAGYKHAPVNHSKKQYVVGRSTTNSLECFWSLLKRGLHGTYVSVQEQHLFRYIDERAFTYNLRALTDLERFQTVLRQTADRRLTYEELTGKAA